jgi:hypothetical protein
MKLFVLQLLLGCGHAVPAVSADLPPVEVGDPSERVLVEGDLLVMEGRSLFQLDDAPWTREMTVHQDGTYTRGGQTGTLPPELVADLRNALRKGFAPQELAAPDPRQMNCMAVPSHQWVVTSPAIDANLGSWAGPCAGAIPENVTLWTSRIHQAINRDQAGA